ncbi:hypothetical protein RDV77_01610 [Porphyromonadaceae sp. NP-X]|nr:hypothetical protein [Porphyromonadaceae sp. NP-X]
MSKFSSLQQLINSLTQSERKKISMLLQKNNSESDYYYLYKLISESPTKSLEEIKELFYKEKLFASFNTAVSYLFDSLLKILIQLRYDQDSYFKLFNMIMKAKVLYEKSIYSECFQLLEKTKREALKYENYALLFIAQKTELDYLLTLDFLDYTEEEITIKQIKINETMKILRKINEHSFLYELLKLRILNQGNIRFGKQINDLNDLVISEMSIISSSGIENFEIQKNHKLFQSNYLSDIGDYKSALNSFRELDLLFEQNMDLLSNPPIYYLNTLEGILENLRTMRKYNEMDYYIEKLKKIQSYSTYFTTQVDFVIFLYKLIPLIDIGKFIDAKKFLNDNKDNFLGNLNILTPIKKFQLLLNGAIIFLGTNEPLKARKLIIQITGEKDYISKPLLRSARLINLIIMYELKEFDYIDYEIRSLKREIKNSENAYQIEQILIKVINHLINNFSKKTDKKVWEKLEISLNNLYISKFELQVLKIFDFGAWIKSKFCHQPLSQILEEKNLSSIEI